MADIHIKIQKLLDERGISGAKMCADLGMSRSFMTELRKGRAKGVTVQTAQKIADYFQVSTDYLLNDKPAPIAQVAQVQINPKSPIAQSLNLARAGHVRRAKLCYLRNRVAKANKVAQVADGRNYVQLQLSDGATESRELSDEQMTALRGILMQMPKK